MCEQGILDSYPGCRVPRGGGIGAGPATRCFHFDKDLRGRARPPLTAPGIRGPLERLVLRMGLFYGARLGGSEAQCCQTFPFFFFFF